MAKVLWTFAGIVVVAVIIGALIGATLTMSVYLHAGSTTATNDNQSSTTSYTNFPNLGQLPPFPTTEQQAQQVLQTNAPLARTALGEGWHVETGTLHVYPGNCVDVAAPNQMSFPYQWMNTAQGFTRALVSGEGTVTAPATVYWSGCYRQS